MANEGLDLRRSANHVFVLPHPDREPPIGSKRCVDAPIAEAVGGELQLPVPRFQPEHAAVAGFIDRVPVVGGKGIVARSEQTHAEIKRFFGYLEAHIGPVIEPARPSELLAALPSPA